MLRMSIILVLLFDTMQQPDKFFQAKRKCITPLNIYVRGRNETI